MHVMLGLGDFESILRCTISAKAIVQNTFLATLPCLKLAITTFRGNMLL